jgi:hypothetical protein
MEKKSSTQQFYERVQELVGSAPPPPEPAAKDSERDQSDEATASTD